MNEIQYKKLCEYLNDVLPIMEFNDGFFLDNLNTLSSINDSLVEFLSHYDLNSKPNNNKLTCKDIYIITRDFIYSACPKYLSLYDKIINNGELDFSFEEEYSGSYFQHINPNLNVININREFSYNDVITLVHEFMHYTNGYKKSSTNRYVLTEFISIYFELLCTKYLIDNGVDKQEIGYCDRLRNTYNNSLNMYFYEMILSSYRNFGCIDYDMTYKYIGKTTKEGFEDEAHHLLEYFEKIESKCINNNEKIDKYSDMFRDDYRYIFGTILAFYAYEYCELDDILYLNDHINDDKYENCDLIEILKTIGITYDNEFLGTAFSSIEDYMKLFNIGLKR